MIVNFISMKMLHKLRKMQGKYFSNSHLRYFKTRNIISLAEHRNGGSQIIETDQRRNLF